MIPSRIESNPRVPASWCWLMCVLSLWLVVGRLVASKAQQLESKVNPKLYIATTELLLFLLLLLLLVLVSWSTRSIARAIKGALEHLFFFFYPTITRFIIKFTGYTDKMELYFNPFLFFFRFNWNFCTCTLHKLISMEIYTKFVFI